jgi:beta-lactamase class C
MSTLKLILGAAVLAFLCLPAGTEAPASPAPAWPVRPPGPPLPPELLALADDYDRYFSEAMRLSNTPGAAVVIVKDSQVVFQRGYGLRVAGQPDSVNIHTVFRVGSLSKGFAGVLTGMLVEEGRLDWQTLVQDHYPEFTLRDRKQAARIQLSHLLSHTTGLPYHAYTNLIEEGFDIPTIVKSYFPRPPLTGKEGRTYSYQNAAFCVIEEVMRSATGQRYADLLAQKIFRPAGMSTASCDFQSMRRCPDKARPHFRTRYGWRPDTVSTRYYNSAAAGGVNASIADMGEWLKLLLGHRPDIVSETTLDQVFRPVVRTTRERRVFNDATAREQAFYAMGWRVVEKGGETIVYHGGYVNGFRGEIALNRRDGIAICVLFNAHTELTKACVPAFFERWNRHKAAKPANQAKGG